MRDEIEALPSEAGKAPEPGFLRHYVSLAVRSGEVARTNPYKSSISTGQSGLAFGKMQNDTGPGASNKRAQDYFRKILDADVAAHHLDKAKADAIYKTALSKPRSLSKADIASIDAALMRNKALVNEIDDKQLDMVMDEVERAFNAAEMNPNGPGELSREKPNLGFVAELAMWSNRSNGLKASADHISKMPSITRTAWETNYLREQRQFTREEKPESWPGWQKKVNRAIRDAEEGTRPRLQLEPGDERTPPPTGAMLPYARPNGNSGVVAYRIDGDSITLRFVDRPTLYVYDANRPGLVAVQEMQRLARRGTGLTTYINQHVRKNYALKIG